MYFIYMLSPSKKPVKLRVPGLFVCERVLKLCGKVHGMCGKVLKLCGKVLELCEKVRFSGLTNCAQKCGKIADKRLKCA